MDIERGQEERIVFQTPPFPYYVECGFSQFAIGELHPSRQQLGMFDLLFVTKGILYIGEEDNQWALKAGEMLILLPDRFHYAVKSCDEETHFFWVHFQAAGQWVQTVVSAISGRTITLPKTWTVTNLQHLSTLLERLHSLSVESRTIAYWEEQTTFWEILRFMNEGGKSTDATQAAELASRTEAYLKQNYQNELTNQTLADALHFHPNYIARCMKDTFDCTPMAFLHDYRLEQAKLLLLKTEWPVSRIAEQVGFRFTPYFSSCFKKKVGVSPLTYRKQFS